VRPIFDFAQHGVRGVWRALNSCDESVIYARIISKSARVTSFRHEDRYESLPYPKVAAFDANGLLEYESRQRVDTSGAGLVRTSSFFDRGGNEGDAEDHCTGTMHEFPSVF